MSLGRFLGGVGLIVGSAILATAIFVLPIFFPMLFISTGGLAQFTIWMGAGVIIGIILFFTGVYYAITGLRRNEIKIINDTPNSNNTKTKHRGGVWNCNKCGKEFFTEAEVKAHVKDCFEGEEKKKDEKEHDEAIKILRMRYAKGEIKKTEFDQKMKDLK